MSPVNLPLGIGGLRNQASLANALDAARTLRYPA
jgi:hypothetical protein